MKFTIITLFPEFFKCLNNYSVIGRAIHNKILQIKTINLRDFGLFRYQQVDDKPYGGGVGMLLRVDVMHKAIKTAVPRKSKRRRVILLTAEGERFTQEKAEELALYEEIVLIAGHYEGFDRRIDNYVDEKISIGDFIISGGETAAITIIDSVARLKKGVLGKDESSQDESFSTKSDRTLLEYPQYTRPEVYEGLKVPEILLSGNHKKIQKWREEHRNT